MPWHIEEKDNEYCVYKDGEREPLGCHATQGEADAQMRALYASESKSMKSEEMREAKESHARALYESKSVKMASKTEIEGLGIPWGGPFNGKDIEGEFFSPRTELALDWFSERPLLYQHGLDNEAKLSVVGRVKAWTVKDMGVWVKAQLDAQSEYFEAIRDLVKRGTLFFSSGAMRHLVKVDKSGEIRCWPWVELSLTPTPANLYAELDVAAKHFDVAGLKAVWSVAMQNDLPDSSFAYIEDGEKDEEGKTKPRSLRHFPYRDADGKFDEAHVRNALARIPQSTLPQEAKDKALTVVRKAAKELGIEVTENKTTVVTNTYTTGTVGTYSNTGTFSIHSIKMASWETVRDEVEKLCQDQMMRSNPFVEPMGCYVECTYSDHCIVEVKDSKGEHHYWVPFKLGEDGHVAAIGPVEEADEEYVKKPKGEMPMGMMMETTKGYVQALVESTRGLHQRRVKEGRMISNMNRKKLADCVTAMREASTVLTDLLDSSEPKAKADDSLQRRFRMLRLYAATLPQVGG